MKRTLFPPEKKLWWAIRNKGRIFINLNGAWRWLTSDAYGTERGFWEKKKNTASICSHLRTKAEVPETQVWTRSITWKGRTRVPPQEMCRNAGNTSLRSLHWMGNALGCGPEETWDLLLPFPPVPQEVCPSVLLSYRHCRVTHPLLVSLEVHW